ncbi:MAG: PH domain-containing protein [Candidatus Spechtbacterales bacterium]
MTQFEEGEQIILQARRHWITVAGRLTGLALFSLLAVVLLGGLLLNAGTLADLMNNVWPGVAEAFTQRDTVFVGTFFMSAWLLLMWMMAFSAWTDYYLDVLVITNSRVIDIEQLGFFSRDVATIPLRNIQDIKFEMEGMLATFLKFGTLHIQTAGAEREVVLRGLRDPEKVKAALLVLHKEKGVPMHEEPNRSPDTLSST